MKIKLNYLEKMVELRIGKKVAAVGFWEKKIWGLRWKRRSEMMTSLPNKSFYSTRWRERQTKGWRPGDCILTIWVNVEMGPRSECPDVLLGSKNYPGVIQNSNSVHWECWRSLLLFFHLSLKKIDISIKVYFLQTLFTLCISVVTVILRELVVNYHLFCMPGSKV